MHCLVVEDQTILLDLLAAVVESFPEITTVLKANCVQTATTLSQSEPLEIAILDLQLPDGDGQDLGLQLVEQHPEIQLIILSGSAQEFICPQPLRPSIRAVIDKTDAFHALRQCLNTIIQPAHQELTERQKQIYALIGEGKSTKEIAQILDSAVSTIETHRKAIAKNLNLSGAELVRAAALSQHLQNIH